MVVPDIDLAGYLANNFARYPAESKCGNKKNIKKICSLFHSYFVHIEKDSKKKFAYSKFA